MNRFLLSFALFCTVFTSPSMAQQEFQLAAFGWVACENLQFDRMGVSAIYTYRVRFESNGTGLLTIHMEVKVDGSEVTLNEYISCTFEYNTLKAESSFDDKYILKINAAELETNHNTPRRRLDLEPELYHWFNEFYYVPIVEHFKNLMADISIEFKSDDTLNIAGALFQSPSRQLYFTSERERGFGKLGCQ